MVMILDMIFLNNQQNQITNSRCNDIQSYYLSEGKILMSLYVDEYYNGQLYPAVLDVFRKHDFRITSKKVLIHESDLEDDDHISEVKLAFENISEKQELVIKAQSDYKGIKTSVKAYTTLVNDLFEIGESVLSMDNIKEKHKSDLGKLLINIEENIAVRDIDRSEVLYATEISNFSRVCLEKTDGTNYKLICTRETMEQPYVEGFNKREIFMVVRNFQGNKPTFHIDCSDSSISLSGIIYVEGDIEISGDFTFNGIIIVNGGEVITNGDKKPKIIGMMILYGNDNIHRVKEKIDLQYYDFTIYKYGTFIPGFLDINLKSIKNGE